MKTVFLNTENSKTNELQKFVLNMSQELDMKRLNKHVAIQKLSIYFTWKNIRQQCKNSKLKIFNIEWPF